MSWKSIEDDQQFEEDVLLYYPPLKHSRGQVSHNAWITVGNNSHVRRATHFMPLPKPPEPPHE